MFTLTLLKRKHDWFVPFHFLSIEGNCQLPFVSQPISTKSENPIMPSSLEIFPNPTSGPVTIRLNQARKTRVTFSDIQGKVVLEKVYHHTAKGQKETILLSDLSAGVYTLQVNDGTKFAVQKVVKH